MNEIYEAYTNVLNEKFINVMVDDIEIKNKWADQVWTMLQRCYKDIGGIKGNGFSSKEDMIKSIPMWKLALTKGELKAVLLYKDKGGRKTVAGGTDGTISGKKKYLGMIPAELKRSFGEKSKAALAMNVKSVPWDMLQNFILPPEEVSNIIGKKVIPIKGYKGELPEDANVSLKKFPKLIDYGYLRDIQGVLTFKVAFGTPGIPIK